MKKARSLLLPFRRVNTPQRTTVNCCEIPGSPPSSCEEIERRPNSRNAINDTQQMLRAPQLLTQQQKESFLSRTHIVAVVLRHIITLICTSDLC